MPIDLPTVTPDERGLDALLAKQFEREGAAEGPLLWDALTRWFHRDPEDCRRWAEARVGTWPDRAPFHAPLSAVLLHDDASLDDHVELQRRVRMAFAKGDGGTARVEAMRENPEAGSSLLQIPMTLVWAIDSVFVSEITLRLGTIPYLISTPTREDGLLSLDTLLSRLLGYGDIEVGPLDLFLALTRLEPIPAGAAAGVRWPQLRIWNPEDDDRGLDVAGIVSHWVEAGGLPPRSVHHRDGELVADEVRVPIPLSTFGLPDVLGSARGADFADNPSGIYPQVDLSLAPTWVDYSAVRLQRAFDGRVIIPPRWLVRLAESPSPGPGVVHLIAATLVHAKAESREQAVAALGVMASRRLWLPDAYAECCAHMATEQLHLGRLTETWSQVVEVGGPELVWPAAMTLLNSAASRSPLPAKVAALLELLAAHVPTTWRGQAPAAVVALAKRQGSSAAQRAARTFVDAVQSVDR